LLKRLITFLKEYDLISKGQESALRSEFSTRIPEKRAAEVIRLARAQHAAQEALARERAQRAAEAARKAKREEEEYWNFPEVLAEVAAAETAHLQRSSNPAQELIVLAEPSPELEPSIPANPSFRVRISAEELALIVSFRQVLDARQSIHRQIYRDLAEFDRLGLEAILNLAGQVVGETLPCAQVVPTSTLRPFYYNRLGGSALTPSQLRSGRFYSSD
jgi:hypothetical protein